MARKEYNEFTKAQKIAGFFIMIGPQAAAEIMKDFDTPEIEMVCREMANLEALSENVQQNLIEEFCGLVSGGYNTIFGGVGYARTVLSIAKGDKTANSIISRVAPESGLPSSSETDIRSLESRQIINLIRNEQPQTIAFILAYLGSAKASQVLMMLPQEQREDIVERMGGMQPTSTEVVQKIVQSINHHLGSRQGSEGIYRGGGVENVAEVLNSMDKEIKKSILARIEERNAPLGAAIRKKVFGFEDITRLDKADLQRIMREVDMADLALALKLLKPPQIAVFMVAISKRAAEGLRDDMELLGNPKTKDIEAAQDRIIQIVRRLEESNEITIDIGAEDHV